MTRHKRALILDFGGVLTTDLWAAIRAGTVREGLPEDFIIRILREDPTVHDALTAAERGDGSQADFEEALARTAGVEATGLLGRLCADLRPDNEMLCAVNRLRREGVQLGVLSNSWGLGYFDPYLGYDLEHRVDAIVISTEVRMRKPEPEIFQLMLAKLGLDDLRADEAVFVDDTASNLGAASRMGMAVIHHQSTAETLVELARLFEVQDLVS